MERTPDDVVCATALENNAILVAVDGDMKALAKRYGQASTNSRFERLNLIRIGCDGIAASQRVQQAMGIIEFEWAFKQEKPSRRMWIDVGRHSIRTNR